MPEKNKREIIVGEHSGFCYGVKRAYEMTIDFKEKNPEEKIYTYGPLIHNPDVIEELKKKDINSCDDLNEVKSKNLVIRAHGVSRKLIKNAQENGFKILDATCPFVKRIHKIVENASIGNVDEIIIFGNPKHPEIIGIAGHCNIPYRVCSSIEELEDYKNNGTVLSVVQTTFNTEFYKKLIFKLKEKVGRLIENNTICSATVNRQDEVKKISKISDLVIVLGGKESSNTRKLFEIVKKMGKPVIHIENFIEIDFDFVKKYDRIGVVAGASTPRKSIDELVEYLRNQVK